LSPDLNIGIIWASFQSAKKETQRTSDFILYFPKHLVTKTERYDIKGNLLLWLGSYISAREQQVIITNAISGKGNLKAGFPQWSILGTLLFFVFTCCSLAEI
jgi:hypothetical protein